MHKDVKEILYSQEEITEMCKRLGKEISKDYEGKEIILIGLLKGSIPFLAELSKYIECDCEFDYMKISSYEGVKSNAITVKQDVSVDIKGKHLLVVEDILDTGKTLDTAIKMFKERGAASVEIAAMLDKVEARKYDVHAKYAGFVVPNAFVVGYGLDYDQKYRNLPYIGILKEEVYQ